MTELASAPADPLSSRLLERVQSIAVANGIVAQRITVAEVQRQDHLFHATFDLQLSWRSDATCSVGAHAPAGSRHVADRAAIDRLLTVEAHAATATSDTPRRILAPLSANPVVGVAGWKDGDGDEISAARFHCHEPCNACGGQRGAKCTCGNGREPCPNLYCQYGKERCIHCGGAGGHAGQDGVGNRFFNRCSICHGSGMSACRTCGGHRWIHCRNCGGTAWFDCQACGGHGVFTVAARAWLTRQLSWSWRTEGVGEPFRMALEGQPLPRVLDLLEGITAELGADGVPTRLVLRGRLPTVLMELDCAGSRASLAALGPSPWLPDPPAVLDAALRDRIATREDAKADPTGALARARATALGRALLAAVVARSELDAAGLARSAERLVSESLLRIWHGGLEEAYGRTAGASVRRAWLAGLPLSAGGAAALAWFEVPAQVFTWIAPAPDWARPLRIGLSTAAVMAPVLVH